MTQEDQRTERIPRPCPPNPIQREALFRLNRSRIHYLCSDQRQGILLCWNLIRRQLKNNNRVAILCPDPGVRAQLIELLEQTGLSALCLTSQDTPAVIRQRLTVRKQIRKTDPLEALPWHQWKRRTVNTHQEAQQNLFGERPYRVLAHEWLRSRTAGAPEILEARLDPTLFQFTPQEFYQLRGRIKEAENLFNPQLLRLKALERLHPRFYQEMNAEEAESWLYDQLDEAMARTRELLHRLHTLLSSYKKYMQTDRFSLYAEFREAIDKVRDRLEAARMNYGDELEQIGSGIQDKLRQSFSSRSKEVEQVRKQLKLAYMELHRSLEASAFGPYIAPFEDLAITSISQLLDAQEQCLKEYWPVLLQRAEESQIRLNSQNLEGNAEQQMVIRDLEKDIENWLRALNDLEFFERPIEENALSLTKKGEVLSHILDMLEEIMGLLPRFIPFHEWMSFALHLAPPARKLIALLGEEQNVDWQASFEAWYFSQLLARHQYPEEAGANVEDIPELWQKKNSAQLSDWLEKAAELDPDGGWLTRLNAIPDNQRITISDDPEWERQFPVHIYDHAAPVRQADHLVRVLLFPGQGHDTPSPSEHDLIIGSSSTPVSPEGYQRLFDPRTVWPQHSGALLVPGPEKIHGIRDFVSALIFEVTPARLYQSRDMLLLSRWPKDTEEMLLQKLGRNMKTEEISQEEDAVPLIEGLLNNDRPLFLLVEDLSLSRIDPVWEKLVQGWCAEAGFRIVSLDWQDCWRNEHNWLDTIVSRIRSAIPDGQ